MSVPISVLQTHLKYTAWASKRLVEAAGKLTSEELTRDFKTADKSVVGTLAHVFAADRIWIARVKGEQPAKFFDPEHDCRLETLRTEWPAILERWLELTVEPEMVISYKDLKGNPYSTPFWQIVLHVVNHGTAHRGQVSGMLRAMGHPPPPTDLIAYYRTL